MPEFRNLEAYRGIPPHTQLTFSMGGSSAYKLWHILEANSGLPANCVALTTNTGFEDVTSLDFWSDFQRNVGCKIVMIERDGSVKTKFREVGHNSADRSGGPFIELVTEPILRKDGTVGPRPLPSDGPRRLCSGELKTKTAHRYLRSLGWGRYFTTLGFRADEKSRVDRRRKSDSKRQGVVEGGVGLFPLFDAGVVADDVIEFGASVPWWLPQNASLMISNCNNCFMFGEWKMKERMAARPLSVAPWIAMEGQDRGIDQRTGARRNAFFRPGRKSMQQLLDEVRAGDFSVDPASIRARPGCGTCHD